MTSSRCPTPGTEPSDCGISIQVRLLGLLQDTPRIYAAFHSNDRSLWLPEQDYQAVEYAWRLDSLFSLESC
ncbi:hypothetical protein CY35_19G019000 [Sphagnum magellanicum]|nr:hypothetical protein CY35_19G019000 [Sphagnum magellanicum]